MWRAERKGGIGVKPGFSWLQVRYLLALYLTGGQEVSRLRGGDDIIQIPYSTVLEIMY